MMQWIIDNWEGIVTIICLIMIAPIITLGAKMTKN